MLIYFVFRKEHLLKQYALGIDIGGTSIKGAVFSKERPRRFLNGHAHGSGKGREKGPRQCS
jgi:N-methylhydantoinase A/oxoprolinase/acetone carboxylase beta subunit